MPADIGFDMSGAQLTWWDGKSSKQKAREHAALGPRTTFQ